MAKLDRALFSMIQYSKMTVCILEHQPTLKSDDIYARSLNEASLEFF